MEFMIVPPNYVYKTHLKPFILRLYFDVIKLLQYLDNLEKKLIAISILKFYINIITKLSTQLALYIKCLSNRNRNTSKDAAISKVRGCKF